MTTASKKPFLIVIIGPTAVGKTKMSLDIAKEFDCEIISGDSMQVYRGMDIGTAKASPEERSIVPHHLIDIRDPDEPFSAADFKQLAGEAVEHIVQRGRIPMIVGGTGLYIESFCYDFQFTPMARDEEVRQRLKRYAEQHGKERLYAQLQSVDPVAAERVHPNDLKRIIRALEIYHTTGQPMTSQIRSDPKESPFDLCMIGLTMDRSMLYQRIEERVDGMIQQGLVDEVKSLLAKGYTKNMVSMQGLGYKEIISYLEGEYDWDMAVNLLKRNTRRFAKRQLSWFRRMKEIHWVDVTDTKNKTIHTMTISGIITRKLKLR